MRTTLNIDDDLLQRVQQLTGINEKTAIVRSGLEALIARERDAVVNGPEVVQEVADYLKNRVAPPIARTGLPQIRTCAISASGSSDKRFATVDHPI